MKNTCLALTSILFLCLIPLSASAQRYTISDTTTGNRLISETENALNRGQYDQALAKADSARHLFDQIYNGPSKKGALASLRKGAAYFGKGKTDDAIAVFKETLAMLDKTPGACGAESAKCLFNLGNCYRVKSEYGIAIDHYMRSAENFIRSEGADSKNLAAPYNNLGACYQETGEYNDAVNYHQKALAIRFKTLGAAHPQTADSYDNLGNCYYSQGDYDKSIIFHQKALDIYLNSPNVLPISRVFSYINLGDCYDATGKYAEAQSLFQKAQDLIATIGGDFNPTAATVYSALGAASLHLGEIDQAIEYHQKALDCGIKTAGPAARIVNKSYAYLSACYYKKGDFEKAVQYSQKSSNLCLQTMSTTNPAAARAVETLGALTVKAGRYAQADSLYRKALAAQGYQKAYNFTNTSAPNETAYLLAGKGAMERAWSGETQNDSLLDRSAESYRQGLAALAYQDKRLFSDESKSESKRRNKTLFEGAIATALLRARRQKSPDALAEAFSVAERYKTGVLQGQLKAADALHFAGIPDSLLQLERTLRREAGLRQKEWQDKMEPGSQPGDSSVVAAAAALFEARQNEDSLKRVFEIRYPEYYRLKYDLGTVSIQSLQKNMPASGQTLVSYFTGDSSIVAFVVRKDTFAVFELPRDFDLAAAVSALRQGIYGYYQAPVKTEKLYDAQAEVFAGSASLLYQKLLAPFEGLLTKEIMVLSDGILNYAPFDVLLTQPPKKAAAFSALAYFGKNHIVSYNYSATLWKEMRDKKPRTPPKDFWIGFAPYYNGDTAALAKLFPGDAAPRKGLDSLKYSGREVFDLQKMTSGQGVYGKAATQKKFLTSAAGYRILHLATHGKANDKIGEDSFLAFAQDDSHRENGLLFARDIYNMELNADLVVLSACETGVGELQQGEGIISLARAFAYAGAKSVVASLWNVDDRSSMLITEYFYRALLQKNVSKDGALWRAKQAYLSNAKNEQAHPFFWAAFIPIGDMAPVVR